jgi:hypothetical protein
MVGFLFSGGGKYTENNTAPESVLSQNYRKSRFLSDQEKSHYR